MVYARQAIDVAFDHAQINPEWVVELVVSNTSQESSQWIVAFRIQKPPDFKIETIQVYVRNTGEAEIVPWLDEEPNT
ncbi:MAG: hypothetical protein K1Y36_05845 [Blastocatellia bacterium]|nr:hypothetical protein [Blastocatellia bacterium]